MESESEVSNMTIKKRRLQNSCDSCRKRKIKCDSANMPRNICSNCKSFGVECTHLYAKKKRGPPKGTPKGKRTIQSIVSSILSPSKPYEIPEDTSILRELLIDLANYIRSLEDELAEARKSKSPSEPSASVPRSPQNDPSTSVEDSSIDELSSHLKYLEIDEHSRHWGQSSSHVLVKNALAIKKEYTGVESVRPHKKSINKGFKRLEYWTIFPWQLPPPTKEAPLTFPEPDLLHNLIDLYFLHVNIFVPILHRPTFQKSISQNHHLSNRQFGFIVLTVCAVGARYSTDSRVYLEGSTSGHSVGWQWFRQVKPVKSSFVEPSGLYDVQLYGLYVIFIQVTTTAGSCWVMVGLGVRLAQEVGAHRRKVDGSNPKNTVESELWKRAFWMLYVMDVFASAILGRPRALSSEDFDIDLPIECDDEYWPEEQEGEEEEENSSAAFKQPPGKPSTISAWVLMIRLFDILALTQRTIYAVRRTGNFGVDSGTSASEYNQRAVVELDSRLNEWIESLPSHLKWDPHRENATHFKQSVLLHTIYYWVQIQVHRTFVSPGSGSGSGTTFPSLAICANAARSCVHVMEVQQRRGGGDVVLPNISMKALFHAAIFLTLNVWRGGKGSAPSRGLDSNYEHDQSFGDVYRCLRMMRVFEHRWQEAGRLYDVLADLVSVAHLRTSAKRQRTTSKLDDPEPSHIPGKQRRSAREVEEKDNSESVFVQAEGASTLDSAGAGAGACDPNPLLFAGIGAREISSNIPGPFTLPIHGSELGSLPIDSSFGFSWPASFEGTGVSGSGLPDPFTFTFQGNPAQSQGDAGVTPMMFSPEDGFASVNLDPGTVQTDSSVAGGADFGSGHDYISSYSQRWFAQGLSTALEASDHGISRDAFTREGVAANDEMMHTGLSNEHSWGSYSSADVDELIRAMNQRDVEGWAHEHHHLFSSLY